MTASLALLIVSALWRLEAVASPCPAGSDLVTQQRPQGKEERCILGRSGKRHGPFRTWYRNGHLREEGTYRYGQPQGRWTYYYRNGQKQMEGNWQFGKAQGVWTYWYEDGSQESSGRFLGGKRAGHWIYWDTAGAVRFEGDWTDGKLDLQATQAPTVK